MKIPFCPLPLNRALVAARKFYGIAETLSAVFPSLGMKLDQANIKITARDYLSIVIFTTLLSAVLYAIPLMILFAFLQVIHIGIMLAGIIIFVIFIYLIFYPNVLIKKRVRNLERNLLHAMRYMYIQMKGGVTMFDSLISISTGNYGELSTEIVRIIKEVNAGMQIERAMEESAVRNPSRNYRRYIWQVSNSIKVGGDITETLKSVIENMSAEQKTSIRRYGSQLNSLTMMYMMLAVIGPSLGVTFLVIISSFSGMVIGESVLFSIMFFLVVFQIMYIGIMKSRRPNI